MNTPPTIKVKHVVDTTWRSPPLAEVANRFAPPRPASQNSASRNRSKVSHNGRGT
jgi:hypothetical protein